MKLTIKQIDALAKPGLHADGNTLYLNVSRTGAKSWIQRLVIDGKRRDIGLGGYPAVGLREARKIAFDNRGIARSGGDPLADRRKAEIPTFAESAAACIEGLAPSWRNGKHRAQWENTLRAYAFPVLGNRRVDRIGRQDVLEALLPIWGTKPETARRVRQRIRAVLSWAQAAGHIEHNFAGEIIDAALPKAKRARNHFRALAYGEVPEALEVIEASAACDSAKLCLRFLVLTAARSGEARGARWEDMDLDAATWTIPGERMKAGREHRVPLSAPALAVLEQARALSGGSGLVFPGRYPGKPLSDMALTMVLRRAGLAARTTVHGFRSAFRGWCGERGTPWEVAEAALAHVVGNATEQAYYRVDLLDARRPVMDAWGRCAVRSAAQVVSLHG